MKRNYDLGSLVTYAVCTGVGTVALAVKGFQLGEYLAENVNILPECVGEGVGIIVGIAAGWEIGSKTSNLVYLIRSKAGYAASKIKKKYSNRKSKDIFDKMLQWYFNPKKEK